ncbi:MAG: relaxase/mobilization nuclease domain-containing protein [Lachnospiraceae bacterium]|nr:relaxase/mobilization nuclease domain-containing protein [Lachnospiraceae bacterium]
MAITKMMHMKASSKARIDIHLEHSINYILQPKKLGKANLVGGSNCLPDMAYRQMKATKQMFGKTGGRQGYHFVISLKPGEGTPEIMYDIGMRFAEETFHGEYEAVVAVHTDRNHLHAHIVINSVNMVTGYKFQCRDGDWKYRFQPITNKLCEEYGLHITPAEYSKEPTNKARPQWEREQVFSKWIKQDALFCAINAENMEHFIFLLEKLGFEVKQGKHIAVKVPGMKRFKRLDTISEDLSRESLEAMFKYGDASLVSPVNYSTSLMPVRKAILTPYQRKCYTRMYRLRLAEKKRFTYKSAYLYEQIRKLHELQEEYLVVVRYDVKSFLDLFRLKQRLQRVDEELCKVQKEMYRDRALQKRSCKTEADRDLFEASEDDYRERLEQIKLQKKDNLKKLKAVERCLGRDGSLLEAELEYWIPVDDMVDLADVEKDAVPGNPYRVQEDVVAADLITESFVETITEAVAEDEITAEVETIVETATAGVSTEPEIEVVEDATVAEADIDEKESVAPGLEQDEVHKVGETMKLPSDKTEYMRMNVAEKVCCYPFDDKGTDAAFEMVQAYFEKIGMDTSFHSVYEESKLLTDYYEKQKAEEFIGERAERVIETMKFLGIHSGRIAEYSADVLSEAFGFGDMEYFAGMKLFNKVIDRLGVDMDQQRRYEVFDRIYEEGMREKVQRLKPKR